MVQLARTVFTVMCLCIMQTACFPYYEHFIIQKSPFQSNEGIVFLNQGSWQLHPIDKNAESVLQNLNPDMLTDDSTHEDENIVFLNDHLKNGKHIRVARSPKKEPRTSIRIDAQRQKRIGTSVNIGADRNIWRSKSGKSSLDAYGQWSRVYNRPRGRGSSRPQWGAGITFSRRF